jgi:hypothetical protein
VHPLRIESLHKQLGEKGHTNGEGRVRVRGKQLNRVMKTRREGIFDPTGSYDKSVLKTVFIARS